MALRICVAGATGWVGRALIPAILASDDLELSGAVARRAAGRDVGEALGLAPAGVTVTTDLAAALEAGADVLIDYTKPDVVKDHTLAAIGCGIPVVVGASGLTADDFAEIEAAARARGVGVIASGNFALTAALLQHFALIAAKYIPAWEVIDYASAGKADAPSGTAMELAEKLGGVRKPETGVPLDKMHGPREARGADIGGTRVHSLRLPGYIHSVESQFGLMGERLTIRHDSMESAAPYVAGTLLAARRARTLTGLVRGLDTLLFGEQD